MEARVIVGKHGHCTVVPQGCTRPPAHFLKDLALYLRELPGVKRAHARQDDVHLRINTGMPKVRESIVRAVKQFFRNRFRSPAARRFKARYPHRGRPSPSYMKRNRKTQHIALATH